MGQSWANLSFAPCAVVLSLMDHEALLAGPCRLCVRACAHSIIKFLWVLGRRRRRRLFPSAGARSARQSPPIPPVHMLRFAECVATNK